jgi:hypothetical protein
MPGTVDVANMGIRSHVAEPSPPHVARPEDHARVRLPAYTPGEDSQGEVMKYRVIGSNKDTGARMILEMEADSKAAAERKALQAGMYVTRVEDAALVREDVASTRPVSRRRSGSGMGWLVQIIIIAVVAGVLYHFWPQIMEIVGKK